METKHINFRYGKDPCINNLSVHFSEGNITAIIGANGSGKSTLLMLLSKLYTYASGDIFVKGTNIKTIKMKEYSKIVAVVHQKNQVYGDMDIHTIVGYGRLPYLRYHQRLSEEDYRIIDWAMDVTNLNELKHTTLDKLSGGQQQRVWLAMALAQKTPILLLDEPTTYLDIKYQIEMLELIRKINIEYKITIILVHHDINQAIHYSDEIIAMKDGNIVFQGASSEVIHKASLCSVYDIDLDILEHKNHKTVLNHKAWKP